MPMSNSRRGGRKGSVTSQDVRAQTPGVPAADDAALADSAERVSTGMGEFGHGDFPGGASGPQGYGQDASISGGLGQGSGYAQSSGKGGYGQGAPEQGDGGQSGADQHTDERYGQIDGEGKQRGSEFGYGGRGTDQADGPVISEHRKSAAHKPNNAPPVVNDAIARTAAKATKPQS